ncbi:hypothetical protein [Streptomyces clavuligerus]|uniref:Uncharacterized protein n=1 Tax=Streptomyces clavuligerus TaxID=1901 RepID=B5GWJ5_STRCL|nr:hypothetical protein [Streptomyces clavuligerus]ANW19330.1 hypothetical protein BB341_14420 [Streptomyces clavuligerus]AXU13931.1 hypothetical protein D1794_15030 [Streptomyces clavuligerus]EDY50691.1 hypothetical protein SSCG_03701 [Streptomyces clavuligerus]EFG07897.1 Hypothetical protein SCLAV_2824 [Streptomyces clavuligerus]MBY6303902.1 hypothetical protein [Streptomyces clavuligerus]
MTRRRCGATVELPHELVFAPDGPLYQAHQDSWVFCILDPHASGHHYALLETLEGSALWTVWLDDALYLASLPDCGHLGPTPDVPSCCFFAGHGGGHSWKIAPQPSVGSRSGGVPPPEPLILGLPDVIGNR